MDTIARALRRSPSLTVLGGLAVLATVAAMVLLALGHPVGAIVVLLVMIQVLVLGLVHVVAVNYRRQEKRARTWGERHSAGQYSLAQTIITLRQPVVGADESASIDPEDLVALREEVRAVTESVQELAADVAARDTARTVERQRDMFREVFAKRP